MNPHSASTARHREKHNVARFVVASSRGSDGLLFRCHLNSVSLYAFARSTKEEILSRAQPEFGIRLRQLPALVRHGSGCVRGGSRVSRTARSIDAKATCHGVAPEGASLSRRFGNRVFTTAVVVAQPSPPNPAVNRTAQQLRCWVRSALARSAGRLPLR